MRQILFRIPLPGSEHALTIYGYGAMLCIGFLLAILLAARRAKRLGQSPDVIYNAALFCFFGGLIGARMFYVIQYGEHFRSPLDFLKIWEGGLTFYGGFLLAIVAAIGYLRFAKQPILYWLDIIAPSVALGEAFGRLGCFLNGCCYGDVCPAGSGASWAAFSWPAGTIPWQHYADQYLATLSLSAAAGGGAADGALTGSLLAVWHAPAIYPAQLLSFLNGLLLFLLLVAMFRHKRRHGQILFMFMLLYGVSRFLLEWLRADEARTYLLGLPTLLESLGYTHAASRLPLLTISQNVAIGMVVGSVIVLALLERSTRPELQAEYAPAPAVKAPPVSQKAKRRKEKS